VVVDPVYEIEPVLGEADRAGVRLTRVLETHTHADHLSGHGRLALEHGLRVSIHGAAEAGYPHDELSDGDEIPVGSLRIRTIHTPGHRPEHCCFLAGDVLMTGDSLFVGTVARPDLAVEAREGAEGLFHSLERLLELPDSVRVLPGHVSGSLCGTGMSEERSSTIGAERRFNPVVALATVEDFVAGSAASAGVPRPPNMERIVELNQGPWVGAADSLEPLAGPNCGLVLDVREPEVFAVGHVKGAFNIPVSGRSFGTKAGFLVRPGDRIVIHASSPAEAELAARGLHAIGFLELGGYLADPPTPESIEPIGIEELERLLAEGSIDVLDVREQDERDSGYIPGSRNIPYRLLRARADDVPHDRPVATICESGARAAVAASILAAAGVEARPLLHSGVPDWEARGNRTIEFRRCGS
jgi:hydroxyacylglutathione hydrolase